METTISIFGLLLPVISAVIIYKFYKVSNLKFIISLLILFLIAFGCGDSKENTITKLENREQELSTNQNTSPLTNKELEYTRF
jgi:hypothetical protein